MENRKRHASRTGRAAMLLVCLWMWISALSLSAFAASPELSFPVTVRVTGTAPDPAETYTVRWRAVASAPMPGPSDFCDITISGEGTATFPPITFETVGVYRYELFQLPGAHPDGQYDESIYTVQFTVTNSETGSGLDTALVLWKDGSKHDAAEFVNAYIPTGVLDPNDDPGPDTPDPPPVVEPPEDPPRDAPPSDPPPARPSPPGPDRLIQTGQNHALVWLLGGAGTAALALGALWMRRDGKRRPHRKDGEV